MNKKTELDAYMAINASLSEVNKKVNEFCKKFFKTRGGRIGSGMGSLLEALLGYEINSVLVENGNNFCELAWFPDHQYHDFVCVETEKNWDPKTRQGEFFRVEAKSMNYGADESKAHFDVLSSELNDFDALLLIVWKWEDIDEHHCSPKVIDSFFGLAKPITILRDELHLQRNGTFVEASSCPDKCLKEECKHEGEPLNAEGKRERLSGPQSSRPSDNVSFAANFGGLIRMLKTSSDGARKKLRELRKGDSVIDEYISFIHRNFPKEELNHFTSEELTKIGKEIGVKPPKKNIYNELRKLPNYQSLLKKI